MGKLDEQKEYIGLLKTYLSILTAMIAKKAHREVEKLRDIKD